LTRSTKQSRTSNGNSPYAHLSTLELQRRIDALKERRARLAELEAAAKVAAGARRYWADPVGFLRDCFDWPEGKGPTPYQEEILSGLPLHKRVAVRGPHGLGKTALNSWAILWFALTREGQDWKVITTASAWRQLEVFLWPEVHKWARLLKWDVLGRPPFTDNELLTLNLKLGTGQASAVASDRPALIEGAHADHILYIFDESKTIPEGTFDAAEGAFSGAGEGSSLEAFALACSTPGEPIGRFYDIHKRKPGFEDWHVRHVSLTEAVAAGRVNESWAEQRARQWGATSAVYLNRVEGEFASSDEDSVIPLAWVEAACRRWDDEASPGPFVCVGVDVARSGSDATVLAPRYGWRITELRRTSLEDTMQTTGHVAGVLAKTAGYAVVDVIGLGAGVVDRLRELGYDVIAFNAGEGTTKLDSSGELGFVNKRSAAWWAMREMLDPTAGYPVALPPDDLLIGDLTAPKWRVTSGGRIQVESKDDIRKRLGRSTDSADAVIQAFWVPEYEPLDEYVEYYEPVTISPF
jgi:hypothetical protein